MAKKFKALVTEDAEDLLSKKEWEELQEKTEVIYTIHDDYKNKLTEEDYVLIFLSDKRIKEVLSSIRTINCTVGFLPHPESPNLNQGFNISKRFSSMLEEITSAEKTLTVDILYCNDEPVLDYVAIGEIMSFLSAKNKDGIIKGIRNFYRFLKKLTHIKAKPFTIKADEKEELETAGTDLLFVPHSKNAMVSRVFLENSHANDGLFHAFVFAPRSVAQLIGAYLLKLVLGKYQKNTAFDFLGHIKTNRLSVSFSQETTLFVDQEKQAAKIITLEVHPGLKIIPSPSLLYLEEESDRKRAYQVDKLPKGEVTKDIVTKTLPWIRHATTEEFKELFTQLRENAKPRQTYVVLMTLSTILATFGLFSDSSPVIIGAMILAPLMSPIISLSMGVLRQDRQLMKSSLVTVSIGLGVGYLFSIILTLITPLSDLNAEISARTNPNIIDLGIAVISGVAGAYAHSKEEIAKTLAGVAIAVALVPPLAVSGIGIGWGDWSVFFGSFLLVITNLTGMVLAGSLTFLLAGYSPFRIARKGLLISSFIVIALSVPLGYGFYKLVQENRIINSINHRTIENIEVKDVTVLDYNPLKLSVKLVSDSPITEEDLELIKNELEEILEREIILEIDIGIRR